MKHARKHAAKNNSRRAAKPAPGELPLCNFSFADGRRCRMPRSKKHRAFCPSHARQEEQLLSVNGAGADLVSLSGTFRTTTDVNHVLGSLFSLLANNRISPRQASALAYILQLLLQTLPSVECEIKTVAGYDEWRAALESSFSNADDDPEDDPHDATEDAPEDSLEDLADIRAEACE